MRRRIGHDREAGSLRGDPVVGVTEPAVQRHGPGAERDRRNGGDRRHCARDPNGSEGRAPDERHDVLRLGARRGEDAVAELTARLGARDSQRERRRHLPERGEVVAAPVAACEVLLVGLALLGVEGVQRVARGQFVNSGFHDPSVVLSSKSSRKRASPANILLLMVPSGSPSLSASSDWVKPP